MTEPVDVLATRREEATEVDWIQANVYAAYRGEQGRPLTSPPMSEAHRSYECHKPAHSHEEVTAGCGIQGSATSDAGQL
jgi:hypothetical protein